MLRFSRHLLQQELELAVLLKALDDYLTRSRPLLYGTVEVCNFR